MQTLSSSSATFSPCRMYRYELWRTWGDRPSCVFIGLNPSTADETEDDPTIRKCIGYARNWGYGSLCMVNLFAFRATQPKDMLRAHDPIGPANDITLRRVCEAAGLVVAAWGRHGGHLLRDKSVMSQISVPICCLKQNQNGSPAHPLYLKGDLLPYCLT